ncbi:MAG: hypothetical protein QXG65_06515 [Thermoplasmata archaeon]
MAGGATIGGARRAQGRAEAAPPQRPTGPGGPRGALVPIAPFGAGAAPDWRGFAAEGGGAVFVGGAYLALAIALVGPATPIPETAAPISSMPGASYVGGVRAVVVLVVATASPIGILFSPPFLRRILRAMPTFEARSREGPVGIPGTVPAGRAGIREEPPSLPPGGPR